MIFLKNIRGNMILFANVLKRWSFQKNRTGIWSFFYYQKKIFLFPENMILFFRRKIKDDLSQKNTWNYDIVWYALKRRSFQKARTRIWSFFNYQERWYFYIPEIWSHFLFLTSNWHAQMILSLQITFSLNQICIRMWSWKCWWFYKDAPH